MKALPVTAIPLSLALALAACGGGNVEDPPVDSASIEASAAPSAAAASEAATDAASTAASDAPSSAASSAAAAAPTPGAKPGALASAAATAAAAAPAGPPASFAVCAACHATVPGKNGLGPSLAGIWGEKAGAVPGFTFSQAMLDSGLTWNQGSLDRYLADPRGVVPGTKMAFGGVKDAAKRQEIIDYIRTLR